jgi:hypothetical protein
MKPVVRALLAFVVSLFRSRLSLHLEILALQHQVSVYHRSIRRPQVRPSDRILWSWLSRGWERWQKVLVFVQPATVLACASRITLVRTPPFQKPPVAPCIIHRRSPDSSRWFRIPGRNVRKLSRRVAGPAPPAPLCQAAQDLRGQEVR